MYQIKIKSNIRLLGKCEKNNILN